MNLQDVFNAAWNHAVVKRMPKAAGKDGNCYYRTHNGNACLIGVSIKDTQLHAQAVRDNLPASEVAIELGWKPYHGPLVAYNGTRTPYNHLQVCHDALPEHLYKSQIESKLRQFAKHYGLKVPE